MNPYNVLFENSESAFGEIFNPWRFFRVKKLEQVLGKEWFAGKKVLELGCGYGNVGHYFSLLGADVTFSDARQVALDIVKKKNSDFRTILLNQETKWKIEEHYDLIIHFGISYNLNYWENDLLTTLKHSDIVVYETAVSKYNSDVEYKIVNFNYTSDVHGPFSNIGSLVSSSNIETIFLERGCSFVRYDDQDLNCYNNCYNWKETDFLMPEDKRYGNVSSWWNNEHFGGRRYWVIRNK